MPLGLALIFLCFYPEYLHAALGVAAGSNLIGVGLSIKDGATVSRVGLVERQSHPVSFWILVSLYALPSIGFFVFLAFVYG
jgi:hypothetical protein